MVKDDRQLHEVKDVLALLGVEVVLSCTEIKQDLVLNDDAVDKEIIYHDQRSVGGESAEEVKFEIIVKLEDAGDDDLMSGSKVASLALDEDDAVKTVLGGEKKENENKKKRGSQSDDSEEDMSETETERKNDPETFSKQAREEVDANSELEDTEDDMTVVKETEGSFHLKEHDEPYKPTTRHNSSAKIKKDGIRKLPREKMAAENMSVAQILLYRSTVIGYFSLKHDLSLLLWSTASNAQSPVPGLGEPRLKDIPCLCALAVALLTIRLVSFLSNSSVAVAVAATMCMSK